MATALFDTLTGRVSAYVPGCPYPTVDKAIVDAAIETCERTLAWRHEQPVQVLTAGAYSTSYVVPTDTEVQAVLTSHVNDVRLKHVTLEFIRDLYPWWPSTNVTSTSLRERSSTVTTMTTGTKHGLTTNDVVTVSGMTDSTFDVTDATVTVTSTTVFTYADTGGVEGSASDTGGLVTPKDEHLGTPLYLIPFEPDKFHIAPAANSSPVYKLNMILALKPLRSATGMDDDILDLLEDTIIEGALQRLYVIPNTTWFDKELAAYHAKQFIFRVSERRAGVNLGAGRASLTVKMQPFA